MRQQPQRQQEQPCLTLTRNESRRSVLLDLVRAERALQGRLRAQHHLLQQLSDATAQLLTLLSPSAEAEKVKDGHGVRGAGGALPYHSLHELLLLLLPPSRARERSPPPPPQRSDGSRGEEGTGETRGGDKDRAAPAWQHHQSAQIEKQLARCLLDANGLAPSHDLVFGSLGVETQLLLIPCLQAWLHRLADMLPMVCQWQQRRSQRSEESDPVGHAGGARHEAACPPTPPAGTKRARGTHKASCAVVASVQRRDAHQHHHHNAYPMPTVGGVRAAQTEEEEEAAGANQSPVSSCVSDERDDNRPRTVAATSAISSAQLPFSPLFAVAAPALRFRLVCQALWRLLEFLRLLLGLTDADVMACMFGTERPGRHKNPGNEEEEGKEEELAGTGAVCFTRLMQRWVAALDSGMFPAQQQQQQQRREQRLPLVCLLRCEPRLRAVARYLLVDVQEVGDILCGEAAYRQKQLGQGRARAAAGPFASVPSTTSTTTTTPASPPHSLQILCAVPATGTPSGEGNCHQHDEWPPITEVARLAGVAEVLGCVLHDCIRLSES